MLSAFFNAAEFQSTFPRGERQRSRRHYHILRYFNPRSHVGNDWPTTIQLRAAEFQSTFPRGERLLITAELSNPLYFNPRSHVGNDEPLSGTCSCSCISIHVPTWGTTLRRGVRNGFTADFNPRSHVGNDG